MNINAINNTSSVMPCQPIKQIEFAKKPSKPIQQDPIVIIGEDTFEKTPTIDEKYDLACRLAAYYRFETAYYKGLYEKLVAREKQNIFA